MEKHKKHTPQVRFPDFKDEWKEFRLSELMTRISKNNKDEEFSVEEILSLSSTKGIVDRKELLGNTYDKVNHKNYIKTRLNDLVYGKSISADYPYGLFKVNDCRDGLLSTLYFTFKVNNNTYPAYLDRYFSYHNRANNFLKKYVLVGDRYITADANYILSGKIFVPQLKEQQKIAHFFYIVDKKVTQLQEKKTALESYKKGVIQKLVLEKELQDIEFGEIAELRKEKHNPQKDKTSFKCIELEHLEKSTGQLLGYILSDNQKSQKNKFYTNDVLFGKLRPSLNKFWKAEFNGVCSGEIWVLKPKNNLIVNGYLHFIVQTSQFFKTLTISSGSKMPRADWGLVSNSVVSINSDKKEQTKIANFLSKIDDKINTVTKKIEQTKEYKKGLLQKMFV